MAWTITRYNKVYGNDRTVHLRCIADAATQNIFTGLSFIEAFHGPSAVSMTSSVYSFHISPNSSATGAQSFGILGMSGFTSGDEFFITVFGH